MDRSASSLVVATLIMCQFVLGCNGIPLVTGDALPDIGADLKEDDVVVLWALRAQDCLSCQNVARSIREAQRTLTGPNVKYVVVVSGEDRGVVNAFLRVQRIDATTVFLPLRRFTKAFGTTPPPFVLLAADSRVVALWIGRGGTEAAVTLQGPDKEFMATLTELVGVS